jgi:hypothetical protein
VTTRTGAELEARVDVASGRPGNPLCDEELASKFHDNLGLRSSGRDLTA